MPKLSPGSRQELRQESDRRRACLAEGAGTGDDALTPAPW